MKRLLSFIVLALSLVIPAMAQDVVAFEFSDGIDNAALKSRMEQQISQLLTAINRAESIGTDINYSGIDIDNMASQSIGMLWNNAHFRICDDDIVEHCLTLKDKHGAPRGYKVMNIAVEMKPQNASYTDELNQEVTIDMDRTGRITDFNITIGLQQYTRLMKEGVDLEDQYRRELILNYVEQFRTAYNNKDMKFLDAIFSEDALIITGKVVRRVKTEVGLRPEISYTPMGKQKYLANLKRTFAANSYINVRFDDIRIRRHGAKPNYYGVTLTQEWNSQRYNDKGILFLVWDFSDEQAPKIHVRTWQPMETPEDEVFNLQSVKLP
ncbi:MAG: nuclear transport factor 2 family protein [Prevotella sp.]|nr:nuclear transport factor 2 family protein [Prevotella sp.]